MWNSSRSLSCRLLKVLVNISRPATVTTNVKIEIEMKRLNDSGKFSQVLTLFDEVQRREIPRDQAVVQALKACARLKDFQRGLNIHKKLANHSMKNNYIQSSLIHFYSEFHLSLVFVNFWSLILVQCSDVINARRVFDASNDKSMPLCGAMMKGKLSLSFPIFKCRCDLFPI